MKSPEWKFFSIDPLHNFTKAEEWAWKDSSLALKWHREIRSERAKIHRERRCALHASFFLSIMVKLAVQIENAEKAVMYCPNTDSLTHNA